MQAAPFPPPLQQPAAKSTAAPATTPNITKCGSYTVAYRINMARRNRRFYAVLYLFSLFFAIFFQSRFSFNYHTFTNVFAWKTFLFSVLLFSIGSIISLLRHLTFTVWKPAYPSYLAETLAVWTCLDNLLLLAFHAVTSLVIIRTYFSWIMGEKTATQFLLPAGYYTGVRQLNQQNIFVCVYAIILGINYTYGYLSQRKFVVKINSVQQPFSFEVKTSLATLLCNSAKRALWSLLFTDIAFFLKSNVLYGYVAHFFGLYTRVLDQPIGGFTYFDLPLFLRLIIAGTLTSCVYSITNRLFEITYSYTLLHTATYANQFDLLVEGLSEKKRDYIRIAAFSELALISTKYPTNRKQLFDAIGLELPDSAWYRIMVQCSVVINEFRTKIDIEYNGVKSVTAAPVPVITKPVEEQKIRNRLKFSNGDIFTDNKKKYDYDDRTCSIFHEAHELATEYVPDDLTTKAQTYAIKKIHNAIDQRIVKMVMNLESVFGCKGLLKYYYADTYDRRVQMVLNQYQLLIWAVQSLGSLTAASLKEDPYGYVQNDIGNVLNHLLGCLVDVEKYEQVPPAQYSKLLKEYDSQGEIRAVILALKDAIYQIRDTFNEYAQGFQVDDKYKPKWENFLKFRE